MKKQRTLIGKSIIIAVFGLMMFSLQTYAQGDPLIQARVLADQKEFAKAIPLYKELYDQSPADMEVYNEYLAVLIADSKYKDAEKLAQNQLVVRQHDPMLLIDLGRVYLAWGKEKKAEEQFEKSVQFINGDDLMTSRITSGLLALKQEKFAIMAYEKAIEMMRNPFLYAIPLARLYARTGNMEKSINALLSIGPMQMPGVEDTKTTMLELLGNDPKKLQMTQKALLRKINEQPDITWYVELLTWLYTQKGDWEGALMQIVALDERTKEDGERLIDFSRTARKEKQYDIAIKALDAIIEKGPETPMFAVSRAERLNVMMERLSDNPAFT
ncbi:MAG: tetratricopeptide repeat protein, partial [Sphingobacteriales bacterium]